jgi:hypothetical protein
MLDTPDAVPAVIMLMDARRAATALGVAPRTLWQLTKNGRVRCARIGRRTLYDPKDLEQFVESAKHHAE